MRKLLLILPVFLAFGLVLPVFAAKNNEAGAKTGQPVQQQTQTQVQTQQQLQISVSPTGNQIKNRNQNAIENMSEVAKQVRLLLQTRTTGGIGEQVRQIAREQNQSQSQIQEQLDKLESKGKLARFLTGTDYGAVKNLKAQLVQNQVRIEQLTKLQNQLSNQGDMTTVQETIQALNQENTSLQERITAEDQTKSMFGWLFRFFAK